MVMDRVVITEMRSMPQTTTYEEKRIVTIGAAKLITETASHLGWVLAIDPQFFPKFPIFASRQRYAELVELVVNILEAFEHHKGTAAASATVTDAQQEDPSAEGQNNELEYSDPYCKLSYAQHPEPFASDIGNNIKSKKRGEILNYF